MILPQPTILKPFSKGILHRNMFFEQQFAIKVLIGQEIRENDSEILLKILSGDLNWITDLLFGAVLYRGHQNESTID